MDGLLQGLRFALRSLAKSPGLTLAGIGLGLLAALALTRLLASQLYGVDPADPRVLGGVAILLAVISATACLFPALQATRLDPVQALRRE
jgi:putative ABC transport system permease protein